MRMKETWHFSILPNGSSILLPSLVLIVSGQGVLSISLESSLSETFP